MKMKSFNVAGTVVPFVFLVGLLFPVFWSTCRVYVPEGKMAIVTSKTGRPLPEGAILAEPGEKGVQRLPLTEGRHFLNPINHEWRLVPVTVIEAGNIGIVTSKTGKDLPAGEILAADSLSKGVWRDVLGPGTYRLNPEGYEVDIRSAINIPIGYVGVVTSQTGTPASQGAFAGPGEKGVLEKVLQPGLYYINPRAYQVDVVEIGMNQVSIVGKSGTIVLTKAQAESANGLSDLVQNTVASQEKKRAEYVTQNADFGILSRDEASQLSYDTDRGPARKSSWARKALSAATSETFAEAPEPSLPVSDSVAFGMNQFVQFPSSDGFSILLDMTVEFELLPENISRIFMLYGDLPAVVSKIILPQILSISRMKGSGYKARDFIDGEGRQKFQQEITEELVRILQDKYIVVRNAIVSHVEVPADILTPIQAASVAKEKDLTNKTQQETAKKLADLNTELAKVDQLTKEVDQETKIIVATTAAQMRKDVETIGMQTQLQVAQIGLERAKIQAKITEVRGEADVKAQFVVENEEALGVQRRAKVFKDTATLADLQFVESLNPELTIHVLHAGEGTLWTDLQKAPALTVPVK